MVAAGISDKRSMGNIIAFGGKNSSPRKEADPSLRGDGKWICNEKRFMDQLKVLSERFRKLTTEEARSAVLPFLFRGLLAEYDLHMSARCGRFDGDVEIELIPGSDGKQYFAVYTDVLSSYRSHKADYYNTDYLVSMEYLFRSVVDDENCGGICINPFNEGGCMVTRFRLMQLYEMKLKRELAV